MTSPEIIDWASDFPFGFDEGTHDHAPDHTIVAISDNAKSTIVRCNRGADINSTISTQQEISGTQAKAILLQHIRLIRGEL